MRGVNEETGESEVVLVDDGKPYTTLGFLNGPGAIRGARRDLTGLTPDIDYLQEAAVPLESETHGGTDVAAYATGPRSHLLRGVVEQNYLVQIMDYALNLTERARAASGQ